MDSSMNNFFTSIETENSNLQERVMNIENENLHLNQQVINLEKALEKQKRFHRKFAEEVVVSEKIRAQDFNEEKRSLTELNKQLTQNNRQLTTDVSFYKGAYDELCNEAVPACTSEAHRQTSRSSTTASAANPKMKISVATKMDVDGYSQSNSQACTHKSSKVLSKISEKLLLDNKRLKIKLDNLSATIRGLKAKNQQLENFKIRIDNKKLKFAQDSDELENLIESTTTKNRTTFSPEVLAQLAKISEYKIEL